MVQHTTIALVQAVVGLIAIITNASLQTYALTQLHKSTQTNPDIDLAKKTLMGAIIMQFIAAVLMITALIMVTVYRKQFQLHMNKFIYAALIISGLLLLIGGILGSAVAMRLQCYRSNANVHEAWKMSTVSAVIGTLGPIILLAIQAFVKRDTIKDIAREYLTHKTVRVPTHAPIKGKPSKAAMPAYHPPGYKKTNYDY